MTPTTLKKRINLGVRWLNKEQPNWLKKIDIELLDFRIWNECICGQIFGNFWKKIEGIRETHRKGKISFSQAEKYGFVGSDNKNNLLTELWVEKIKELRKKR